jgi:uncharacterized Zn-finger protein
MNNQFECPYCGEVFSAKITLKAHEEICINNKKEEENGNNCD